jgi:hypothetical protein
MDDRAVEWDQGADRHSVLPDPVLRVWQLPRFGYSKLRFGVANALVFTSARGDIDAFPPPQRPSARQVAAKRYTAAYEVDTGVHRCSGSLRLPSRQDALEFTGEWRAAWRVDRPELFVRSNERNVPAYVERLISGLARTTAAQFAIDDSTAAERAVERAADELRHAWERLGLDVTWTTRLTPNAEAVAHQQELQRLRYAERELKSSHHLHLQQDELETARELARADQQHQVAMLQGKQEADLRALEAERVAYYARYLQQGNVVGWALHLAQPSDETKLVMDRLHKEQVTLTANQARIASDLLRNGPLEDYQREGLAKQALATIANLMAQSSPGSVPALPEGVPWPSAPEQSAADGAEPAKELDLDTPPWEDPEDTR